MEPILIHHEQAMLQAHPHGAAFDQSLLVACLQAALDCAQTCGACADACIAEPDPHPLARCIRLNLDCADLCTAVAKILNRQTEPDRTIARAAIEACGIACIACADECDRHAARLQHCRISAEVCRSCAEACKRLVGKTVVA